MSQSVFEPPRWLRGPHLQSILSSSSLRARALQRRLGELLQRARPEIIETPEGVRLEAWRLDHPDPVGTALVFHGWEGCVHSNYMMDTTGELHAAGFEVVRLNFRDHGDTHHLNRDLFHSCRLQEVLEAARLIARRAAPDPLVLVGYSLGGNFALRVAARADFPVARAYAVSPVISPAAGLAAIESAPRIYEYYFMRKWRRSLARKRAIYPSAFSWDGSLEKANLRELTAWLVDRYTGFEDLDAYLAGYSVAGDRLARLAVPTTIITAADDPVIPVADFHQLDLPPSAELEVLPYGGHCGFLDGADLTSWTAREIGRRLVEEFGRSGAQRALPTDDVRIMAPS